MAGERLRPPWPDLVIACGRNAAMPALAVRRASGGRTIAAQIQDPRVGRAEFDLMVVPEHDRLRGPRVITSKGALNRVTPEKLAAARQRFPQLAALPRPILGVLIGGSNRAYRLTLERLGEIADAVAGCVRADGGSVVLTPSRRTGAAGIARLRERLAGLPATIWDMTGDNPYYAYLAVADAFLVTADSVSMVSEAAATGKPVHIVDLPGGDGKFARFHAALREAGITRPFAGRIESWRYPPLDDTARAGAALRALVLESPGRAARWMKGSRALRGVALASAAWRCSGWRRGSISGSAGVFYDPHGTDFGSRYIAAAAVAWKVRSRWIAWAIVLIAAGGAAWLRLTGRPLWRLDRNALIFLVAATAVGPGIIGQHRAQRALGPRPAVPGRGIRRRAKSFHRPPPLPAGQCEQELLVRLGPRGARFFAGAGFAFLLPAEPPPRAVAFGAAIGLGTLVGLARVAAGHHFLVRRRLGRTDRQRDDMAAASLARGA